MDLKPIAVCALIAVAAAAPASAQPAPPPHGMPIAPAPPPVAQDPTLRNQIGAANACFGRAWDVSRDLRRQAEIATQALDPATPDARWQAARMVVVRYVRSRQALRACIRGLEDVEDRRRGRDTDNDAEALRYALRDLIFNFQGQDKFEDVILMRLIDRDLAEAEASTPAPSMLGR